MIIQDDTFFPCNNGRLKLRAFSSEKGELIFYRRPNEKGLKECFYHISPTTTPDSLRECLSLAFGQLGRVRKRRTLFLIGKTRLHLDQVEGLGEFLEIEVPLEEENSETGKAIAQNIMNELGILLDQLIEEAYIDLLKKGTEG